MLTKRTATVIAAGLLLFAMLASGGCLGDSDSATTPTYKKMALIGKVTDGDIEAFKAENVEIVSYSKENMKKARAVLIGIIDNVTDEQKADIKEMFDEKVPSVVSIYEPATAEKITLLKTVLFGEKDKDRAILKEDSLAKSDNEHIHVYSVSKDAEGNIHSFAGLLHDIKAKFDSLQRNDNIRQDDIDAGKVWVKYNAETGKYDLLTYKREPHAAKYKENGSGEAKEKVLFYSVTENVLGQVAESDITIGTDSIKVNFNGEKECLSVQKANELDLVMREGIELPEGEATRVDKIVADSANTETDELTPAEKIAKARALGIKQFIEWIRSKKATKAQMLVDSGYVKPKTRFEKFVAYLKDLLGSTGIALADGSQVNLYNVASCSTATIGDTFSTLTGFSMSVYNTVVAVHQFEGTADDGGKDLYYVGQSCKFTNNLTSPPQQHWYEAGDYYSHIAEANHDSHQYWPNGAECEEGYVSSYKVVTQAIGLTSVECPLAQPDTYNNITTKTVSHASNIGASIEGGIEANGSGVLGKVGLALSGGYSSDDSETYSTNDIEAIEYDNSFAGANIQVNHNVTKIPERGAVFHWTELTESADLAKSTYGPIHKFIWRIPTADRDKATGFNVKVTAGMSGAYSKNSGSLNPEYYTMYPSFSEDVAFVMPPRFCISKDTVNFDENTGKTDYVTVYSQGKWTYTKPEDCKWLELTWSDSNRQLTIAADANDSDATRTAVITLKRTNGTEGFDGRTITVTQSKYSK